jgi:hypothetical protein
MLQGFFLQQHEKWKKEKNMGTTDNAFENFCDKIKKDYPILILRTQLEQATGGILSRRHISNLDSQGRGIVGKIKIGKRTVAYPTDSLIDFLRNRVSY